MLFSNLSNIVHKLSVFVGPARNLWVLEIFSPSRTYCLLIKFFKTVVDIQC